MSDTQQIEIIGSDMVEFTKISANAWKRDGGEFNYCFFFFQGIYRNVTFAIVFNFLGHKNSLFAFAGGILSLNKLLMFYKKN